MAMPPPPTHRGDEKSLDFAVKRFSHLLEAYFPGSEHVYMSVIPDKAAFMETPEGYTPAGAQETADYLAQRLPVEIIDIAPLLALEDYYRTDPHWRQERLSAVAQAILGGHGRACAGHDGGDAVRAGGRISRQLLGQDGGAADGGYTLLHQYTGAGGLHGIRL